jgi:hypothetical protein
MSSEILAVSIHPSCLGLTVDLNLDHFLPGG